MPQVAIELDKGQLSRNLQAYRRSVDARWEKTGWRLSGTILSLSQEEVPIDTGYLFNTGFVRMSGVGLQREFRVGYDAYYAAWVHEDMNKLHGQAYNIAYASMITSGSDHPRREQEKAKYLQDPILNNLDALSLMVATMMRGVVV